MQDRGNSAPNPFSETPVPHYYGDIVRSVFFLEGAVLLAAATFVGVVSSFAVPLVVIFAVLLVIMAALTSPRAKGVHMMNAAFAALGVLAAEAFAIGAFSAGSLALFAVAEMVALGFLTALYYAIKTVRAFASHQVGRRDVVGDFFNEEKE